MQASFTICSAMCTYSSNNAGIENNLSTCGLEGNSFKAFATDMMQEAAQSLVQLVGAKAYRYSHIGGRGIIDSRPFQIFEGSNDMLYAQISESLIKLMKQAKEQNLYLFLKNFRFAKDSALLIKDLIIFDLNPLLSQRKLVDLGQIISRIIAMQMVIELGEKNFRKDLINNTISILRADISGLMGHFKQSEKAQVIEDYHENSSWVG
jgi:hypothetical protein